MLLFRMIRKVFALFRSQNTAHEIAMGCCIGLLAGCIPFNSIWALLVALLLMVILRASFTSFLLVAVLVKVSGGLLDPLLYRLGTYLLDGSAAGVFEKLVNTPVVALLDLHRYVVAGSLLAFVLSFVVVYPPIFFLVKGIRRALIRWNVKHPKMQAAGENKLVRFVFWIFFGSKADYAAAQTMRRSPIRRGVLVTLACFVAFVWVFSLLFGDALAETGFEKGMSMAFNADVSLEKAHLSLIGSSLEFQDLVMVDRRKKGDISRAFKLRGDLDAKELWRKHFVFDEILLENVMLRAARDDDGNFNLETGEEEVIEEEPLPDEEEGYGHLGDLWEKRELGRKIVEKVLDLLFPEEQDPDVVAQEEEQEREDLEKARKYLDIYADHLISRDQPLVIIKSLKITGLDLLLEDTGSKDEPDEFTGLDLEATNLSSNPLLLGQNSVIRLFSGSQAGSGAGAAGAVATPPFELTLTLNWSNPESPHRLEVNLVDVAADRVADHVNEGGKLQIANGTIGFRSVTELTERGFTCQSELVLNQLVTRPAGKKTEIIGLDGEQFCQALNTYLESQPLSLRLGLDGEYTAPRLRVNHDELLQVVMGSLQKTGEQLLRNEMEAQTTKAQEEIEEKKAELEEKLDEEINKGLDKLFGKDKDEDKDKKKKPKKKKNRKKKNPKK